MCTAAGRHRNASLSQARNAPAGLFRPTARRSTEPPLREGKVNHSFPLGKVCPQAIHLQSTRKAAERRPEPHRRQAGSAARHPRSRPTATAQHPVPFIQLYYTYFPKKVQFPAHTFVISGEMRTFARFKHKCAIVIHTSYRIEI